MNKSIDTINSSCNIEEQYYQQYQYLSCFTAYQYNHTKSNINNIKYQIILNIDIA